MEIRDTRNGEWYWVNLAINACSHLTHAEKSVYGALASFSGFKEIRPSFELIGQRSNTSPRMAMKAVKNMITLNLISVEKGGGRGNANIYNLLKCSKGCRKCLEINSEQINSVFKCQETVNKKTPFMDIKGEQKDTAIYNKEIDKKIDNAEQSSAHPFLKEKKKKYDDITPMNLEQFVEWTKKSQFKHIQLIGDYADEKKINYQIKGQWNSFIDRNLRAARRLSPYTKKHLNNAMLKIEEAMQQGYLTKWTLETLNKYLE